MTPDEITDVLLNSTRGVPCFAYKNTLIFWIYNHIKFILYKGPDKVCIVRMMTNTVMLSLVYLFYLLYITWYMYKQSSVTSCTSAELSSRVVSSMKCVLQVVRHTEHIAL